MLRKTSANEQLVEEIERRLQRTISPRVRGALLQVPRPLFFEHYYRPHGSPQTWEHVTMPDLFEISRDEALVTKLDAQGQPLSVNTQPSVLARELEELCVRPGHSILEIGSGSGYSTALLAELTGPTGQVTSLDLDPEHVAAATCHLGAAKVNNVLVAQGDGLHGYPRRSPYHRLLATCAVHSVPRSWLEQLAPRGLLLVNLRLHLCNVFLLLENGWLRQWDGCLLDLKGAHLDMRGEVGVPEPWEVDWSLYDAQPRYRLRLPANLTALLKRPAYSVLLECLLPGLRKRNRREAGETEVQTYLLNVAVPGSAILVQGDYATMIGSPYQTKAHLLQSIEWYQSSDVVLDDYRVLLQQTGAELRLGKLRFAWNI